MRPLIVGFRRCAVFLPGSWDIHFRIHELMSKQSGNLYANMLDSSQETEVKVKGDCSAIPFLSYLRLSVMDAWLSCPRISALGRRHEPFYFTSSESRQGTHATIVMLFSPTKLAITC